MKKLSKQQLKEHADFMSRFSDQKDEVEAAYNKLKEVIDEYNEIVREAEEWRADIVVSMDDYFEDRSESWQEGDAGSAYQDWKSEWENEELSELDEPSEPELEHGDTLDNFPEEPAS